MHQEIEKLGGEDILNEQDVIAFSKAEKLIVELMKDGFWYPATKIIEVSEQREGLRRLRNLRTKGYTVERKRIGHRREFFYKLTKDK